MGTFIIFSIFTLFGIISFIVFHIAEYKAYKRMIEQGYKRKFVITCSADEGSWQWVKE